MVRINLPVSSAPLTVTRSGQEVWGLIPLPSIWQLTFCHINGATPQPNSQFTAQGTNEFPSVQSPQCILMSEMVGFLRPSADRLLFSS